MSFEWTTHMDFELEANDALWSASELELFDTPLETIISRAVKRYTETEKSRNQSIGEARAVQELAFRDAIVSEKSERFGKKEKYFWITINPRKDVSLPDLMQTVQKMYSKKWIDKYAYIFENTATGHMHSHGLIKASYEPTRARKELANSVKNICLVTNVHCFKFVLIDEKTAREKMDYMLGKKKASKMDDVKLTVDWRSKHNIKQIYISEGSPILLEPSGMSETPHSQ